MLRKSIFWFHLVLGVASGLLIAIMSFTGAALAFEKEIIAFAERDARRVEATAAAQRLPLVDVLQRVYQAKSDSRIASIAVSQDPQDTVAVVSPGNVTLYANPYTGEVREGQAPRTRAFMQAMRNWHLRSNFAITPGKPSLGAKLNAAANVGFVVLCFTGLVLWWPRAWNSRVLRPSLWFVGGAQGRARDWNWHNVIGFWTLPVLVILAGSGVVLSYGWAGDLVFRLAGEVPPRAGGPGPRPTARNNASNANAATAGATGNVIGPDQLLTIVKERVPDAELVTMRFNPPLRLPLAKDQVPPSGTFSAAARPANPWPPFGAITLTVDARTGEIRQTDTFANQTAGQRARRWIRLLHTGEAFRAPGQLIAGLACLGACVLVWTGLALAWRRFFGPKSA